MTHSRAVGKTRVKAATTPTKLRVESCPSGCQSGLEWRATQIYFNSSVHQSQFRDYAVFTVVVEPCWLAQPG